MIPEEELRIRRGINLAPMVDFLFLILAVFAVLAVTRTALYDAEVDLVKMDTHAPPPSISSAHTGHTILLSVNDAGEYKWVTEFNEYRLDGISAVRAELLNQNPDPATTKVLLHIDKNANWDSIAQVIFAIRDLGYVISPVYTP